MQLLKNWSIKSSWAGSTCAVKMKKAMFIDVKLQFHVRGAPDSNRFAALQGSLSSGTKLLDFVR